MPAVSKSQQRFFGLVKSMQKGDTPKEGEAGKVAKTMDKDDVDDFASTKHKGKPEKVKREQRVKHLIKKMVRERYQGLNDLFYQQNDMEQAALLAKYGNEGQKKELQKALQARIDGDVDKFKQGIRNVQVMSATDSNDSNTTTTDTTNSTDTTTGKNVSNLLVPAALVGGGSLALKAIKDKKKKKDMKEETDDKQSTDSTPTPDEKMAQVDKILQSLDKNKAALGLGALGVGTVYKHMKDKKKKKQDSIGEHIMKTRYDENLTNNVRKLIGEQISTNENVRNMLAEKSLLGKLAKGAALLGLGAYGKSLYDQGKLGFLQEPVKKAVDYGKSIFSPKKADTGTGTETDTSTDTSVTDTSTEEGKKSKEEKEESHCS